MSKIGRSPITLPAGVTATITQNKITVTGKNGTLEYYLPKGISATIQNDVLSLTRSNDSKPAKALHGLARALVNNMVTGVSVGFQKDLELVGTGYRARMAGNKLILNLGFSHEIEYLSPPGVTITVEGTNIIHLKGNDRQLVGQAAAVIRAYKKPEPYKGKGIRYTNEIVRRKAGKAAKGAAA